MAVDYLFNYLVWYDLQFYLLIGWDEDIRIAYTMHAHLHSCMSTAAAAAAFEDL